MRKLYTLKWRLFTSWCGDRQLNPVNCPIGTVLEFLQARLSAGLTHSTLKVFVAAISAYHASLGGQSVGRNTLVTHFLRGVLRGLQYGPVCHLGTWRWGSRLSVGLPSSLLFTNNFLLLNSEKTKVLIIGPKNHTSNNLQHCLT